LIPEHRDAFGRALLDEFEGRKAVCIVERDDGFVETESMAWYFSAPRKWHSSERRALRHVQGRVLDVGCGAGRVARYLQERGHEVVAIDVSPLSVEICRRRGIRDARLLPFNRIDSSLGRFDSILLFGNNFGLFASPTRARWMLRRLKRLTSEQARIIAVSYDPYGTEATHHVSYHERNRQRGRMAGQARYRLRYQTYATPWFDYLMVSPEEMGEIIIGTGWQLKQVFRDETFYAGLIARV
jgi:SAM-dependent methyltransferase